MATPSGPNGEEYMESPVVEHESVDTEVPMIDTFNPSSSGSQSTEQSDYHHFDGNVNVPEQMIDYVDEVTQRIHNEQHIIDHGTVHSYLPGVQRDIYPAEFLRSRHASVMMHVEDNSLCDGSDDCDSIQGKSSGSASQHQSHNMNGIIQNLPILQLDTIIPFPGTTLPLRISNPMLVGYLRREIEDARTKMPTVLKTVTGMKLDKRTGDGMVKIGIVTRLTEQRRNQGMEWQMVRRRVGSSSRGIEDHNENGNNHDDVPIRSGRMGRWNIHLVRRNRPPTQHVGNDEIDEDEDESDDNLSDNEDGQDSTRHAERRLQQRRRHREESSINYGRNVPRDILLGRIGTIATIISVHEDENGQVDAHRGGNNGDNGQQPSNIIVTALMTDRFRIVAPSVENNEYGGLMYNVREFNDNGVDARNLFSKRPHPWCSDNGNDSKDDLSSQAQVYFRRNQSFIKSASARAYIPTLVFEHMFPDNLVQDILNEMNSSAIYEGMKAILPSIRDIFDYNAFTFWLSSNLPLSISEKLEVLETFSSAERLYLLLNFMRKQVVFIRCRQCRSNIAHVNRIFVVGNAEGTSGAYVNEHGIVHQTTTLTDVLDGSIVCYGPAETRDRLLLDNRLLFRLQSTSWLEVRFDIKLGTHIKSAETVLGTEWPVHQLIRKHCTLSEADEQN